MGSPATAITQEATDLAFAMRIAREAGAVIQEIQRGGFAVEMKPGDEPVTIADRTASERIVAALQHEYPEDTIISEELVGTAGAGRSGRIWFVDPIDGTKDFIRGEDGWSVMIGLAERGEPTVGVVFQPVGDRMYAATSETAFLIRDATQTTLAVSTITTAGEARFVASKSHRSPAIDDVKSRLGIANELNVGSVGLKLCLIAAGVRDLYVNPAAKTKAWDSCAPEAILRRAGGTLTDMAGDRLNYSGTLATLHHLRGLVGSNTAVHAEVITKVAPLVPKL